MLGSSSLQTCKHPEKTTPVSAKPGYMRELSAPPCSPDRLPARGGPAPSSICEALSKGDRLSITPPVRAIGVRGDATPRIFSKNRQDQRRYATAALHENRESQFRITPQERGPAKAYGLPRRWMMRCSPWHGAWHGTRGCGSARIWGSMA